MKKTFWIIPLIIGLVVGTIGLVMLIYGLNIEEPPMNPALDNNWFEISSKKSGLITFGPFLMFAGYVWCVVISLVMYFSTPKMKAKFLLLAKKRQERVNQIMAESYGIDMDNEEKKVYYCQYCGYEMDETQKKCPSCGARKSKTK